MPTTHENVTNKTTVCCFVCSVWTWPSAATHCRALQWDIRSEECGVGCAARVRHLHATVAVPTPDTTGNHMSSRNRTTHATRSHWAHHKRLVILPCLWLPLVWILFFNILIFWRGGLVDRGLLMFKGFVVRAHLYVAESCYIPSEIRKLCRPIGIKLKPMLLTWIFQSCLFTYMMMCHISAWCWNV